ncbi:hypothetical protein Ancab_004574 [Ancistrocladus abbreviatus]
MNELANPTPIVSRPADGMATESLFLSMTQDADLKEQVDFLNPDDVEASKPLGWEGQPARSASFSLPGPKRPNGGPLSSAQIQNDRGKSKRTKKSLMDDILQLHLSKRVIGKGHLRQRIGRQRIVMEDTIALCGQISFDESIRDSQIIN